MSKRFASLLFVLCFLLPNVVYAATACRDYPSLGNKPTDPIRKKGFHASVQVDILTGSGAVGEYQFQESNTGLDAGWENNGAVVNSETPVKYTNANAQFVRVLLVKEPALGTTVRVCVYADGVGE